MDEAARSLAQIVQDTAAGTASKPERLGHREHFIMYKHQSTPSLEQGCRA
jgi:altronate hydrolase